MDNNQKREIVRMRLCGMGYRTIANEVGLSRDIVRNYCKSRGLAGYASEGIIIDERKFTKDKNVCAECGSRIIQPKTGRARIFCSDECRRQWWSRHPELVNRKETAYYKRICLYCGKAFVAYGNKDRKYCSHDCYIRDRFYQAEDVKEKEKRRMTEKLHDLKKEKQRQGIPKEIVDLILDDVFSIIEGENK